MQTNTFINAISVIIGILLTLFGIMQLYVASIVTISPESGRFFAYELAGALLLAGVIFLSVSYSRRVAKVLSVTFLLLLAASMLRLVFSQGLATDKPFIYQAGAVALAVLLVARVITTIRAKRLQKDS